MSQPHVNRGLRMLVVIGVVLALVGVACGSTDTTSPAADPVALGTTSTTLARNDPPVVIGGAPGPDGHRQVRFNPAAWHKIVTDYVDKNPEDPYYEVHSEGHEDFWFGAELHPNRGPGWTGEIGLFATDCKGAGICVRFDPDGGAGPIGPILADPHGEAEIEKLNKGGLAVTFRNLVFRRVNGVSYRVDEVVIDTT